MAERPGKTGWRLLPAWAAAVLLVVAGCAKQKDEALLKRAYALGQEYAWEEAKPLIVDYLHRRPGSPAGHYLLGRYYLHRASPALAIALGEFEVAAADLRRRDGAHGLEQEMTTRQFRAEIHKEAARAHLRWCHAATEHGLPKNLIRKRLKAALARVRRGRALDSQDEGLAEMETTLTRLLEREDTTVPPGTMV